SAHTLLKDYPSLRIAAQARDYTKGLGALERDHDEAVLALFLGSNIGNYDPQAAQGLLRQVRHSLRAGDGLLLGADLKKSTEILEAAYNDALGVTAAFNLNLLSRINRELDADFDLKKFEHRAFYNREQGRIEMHLVSRGAQTIRIRGIRLTVAMQAGETIHTENSYKYDFEQLTGLAAATGFRVAQVWLDAGERFSSNLWLAVSSPQPPILSNLREAYSSATILPSAADCRTALIVWQLAFASAGVSSGCFPASRQSLKCSTSSLKWFAAGNRSRQLLPSSVHQLISGTSFGSSQTR